MAFRTAFTEMFSVRHPIALAPMGGYSGGALAAAVSEGGGLGLVGGGRGKPASFRLASQAIDLINDIRPAADLVGDLIREAETALTRISRSD